MSVLVVFRFLLEMVFYAPPQPSPLTGQWRSVVGYSDFPNRMNILIEEWQTRIEIMDEQSQARQILIYPHSEASGSGNFYRSLEAPPGFIVGDELRVSKPFVQRRELRYELMAQDSLRVIRTVTDFDLSQSDTLHFVRVK